MDILNEKHPGYFISTDRSKLDVELIFNYLTTESYWAKGIPRPVVERSIQGSACFGLYNGDGQVGFARAITDQATFAHLADVFILAPHRGQGLSKWLVQAVLDCPELQGLRRWSLGTADAHGLYRQFGFTALAKPDRFMERYTPDIYQR